MNCKTIVQIEANWIQYEKLKFNKREMAFSGKFHQMDGWRMPTVAEMDITQNKSAKRIV